MLKHMEDLLALQQSLREAAAGKRNAILGNRIDDLSMWVNRESRIVRQMAEKQAAWRSIVAGVLAERGIHPESSMTLSDIAAMVRPEEGREQILKLQGQLLEAIREVKEANERNRMLIEQSLEFVQYTLELAGGYLEQDVTYDKPAQSHKMPDAGSWTRFDARA